MLLYFKTKTCIKIEHANIKLIFITYLVYIIWQQIYTFKGEKQNNIWVF